MNTEYKNRITSEDYADLLFEYVNPEDLKQQFDDFSIHPLNFLLSIVHVPIRYITNQTILQYGYGVMPAILGLVSLDSLEASGILRLRNMPNFNLSGQGTLIGIIDTGIDYTNSVFRNEDGTTRIAAIWDQTIESDAPPTGFHYGTEYTREQINAALQTDNPLELVPTTDTIGHGTMLAGIAGGKEDPANDFYGVAPDAEFVIVKLKPAKKYLKNFFFIPEDALAFQENDVAFGIKYLLEVHNRLKKPMAICLAVNTSQSSHDGRGTLSSYLSLIAATEGIALIIGAGNEGIARRHYYGRVDKSIGFDLVELNVGEMVPGFSMELWGQRPSIFSVEIQSPSGELISRIATGRDLFREITFIFEETIIYLDYQLAEIQSGDQLILFRFSRPVPGIWRIKIFERGDLSMPFHIWLPMEGFISSNTFFIRSDPYTTILTLGNATIPITVTAYSHDDDNLYIAASKGYSRTNEIKPDLAAPGVNIPAPTIYQGYAQFSGTSVSAAYLTGVAAMLLEWGIIRSNLPSMNTIDIKKLLIRGARRNTDRVYPNRDWGYGILDVYNVFDALRAGITI